MRERFHCHARAIICGSSAKVLKSEGVPGSFTSEFCSRLCSTHGDRMPTQPQSRARVAFGPFEVDAAAGELRESGVRVRLHGQAFQILMMLLAHPGEVMTREQLCEQMWSVGTFVDFEHGLSAAMNKLRRALGDSAENPRYIETVPGRGYRFIGPVQEESSADVAAPTLRQMPVDVAEQAARPGSRTTWIAAGAVMGAVFVACLVIWMAFQRPAGRSELRVQQLTTNSSENPVWQAVISPDGKYLAFGDLAGIKIRLISTGETHLLPRPPSLAAGETWLPAAWFPDGTRILASAQGKLISSWSVSVIGAAATRLRNNARVYSVSPDGSLIGFTTGRDLVSLHNRPTMMNSEIWVMGPRGESARKVIAGDDRTYFGAVQWSPTASVLRIENFVLQMRRCRSTASKLAIWAEEQHP